MTRIFSALLISTLLLSSPAFAQDAKDKKVEAVAKPAEAETAPKKEERSTKKSTTPINKWIDAENAMIEPLSNLDKESIYILRQKHSIIRVISVVERDIGAAVKSCGKTNPDMKGAIETRFTEWKNAVKPIVTTARKNLDKEIDKQEIVNAKEFKRVLKLNDEAFEYGDKATTKSPVSEKGACEALISSMNDTEDKMVALLQDTLLPPSVIKSRIDREKKADAEQKKSFTKNAQ